MKRHNYEYVIDILEYIINQIIIISATISLILLTKKEKIKNIIIYILCIMFSVINISFMCNNGFKNKCIISFSNDFSNELVVKTNKNTGAIKIYRNQKFFLFAKEKEQLDYELDGKIKKQWLTNDVCGITYKDKNGILQEYVVTYGDRGNGILPIESMLKQAESDGTIKTIPLYYKQNQMNRQYYAFWKKENTNPVISDFANIIKEMFNQE